MFRSARPGCRAPLEQAETRRPARESNPPTRLVERQADHLDRCIGIRDIRRIRFFRGWRRPFRCAHRPPRYGGCRCSAARGRSAEECNLPRRRRVDSGGRTIRPSDSVKSVAKAMFRSVRSVAYCRWAARYRRAFSVPSSRRRNSASRRNAGSFSRSAIWISSSSSRALKRATSTTPRASAPLRV